MKIYTVSSSLFSLRLERFNDKSALSWDIYWHWVLLSLVECLKRYYYGLGYIWLVYVFGEAVNFTKACKDAVTNYRLQSETSWLPLGCGINMVNFCF